MNAHGILVSSVYLVLLAGTVGSTEVDLHLNVAAQVASLTGGNHKLKPFFQGHGDDFAAPRAILLRTVRGVLASGADECILVECMIYGGPDAGMRYEWMILTEADTTGRPQAQTDVEKGVVYVPSNQWAFVRGLCERTVTRKEIPEFSTTDRDYFVLITDIDGKRLRCGAATTPWGAFALADETLPEQQKLLATDYTTFLIAALEVRGSGQRLEWLGKELRRVLGRTGL